MLGGERARNRPCTNTQNGVGMWQTVSKLTTSTLLAAGLFTFAGLFTLAGPALAGSAAGSGTVCATEQYQWVGQAPLASGESFATGVTVPEQAGTELEVKSVDYSTGEVVTGAVAIRIGATEAAGGATVAGGEIGATNAGTDPLMITAVALSVARCHQVEQAAVAPVAPAAVVAPHGPAHSTVLPATGKSTSGVADAALLCTGLGAALLILGRRRAAA